MPYVRVAVVPGPRWPAEPGGLLHELAEDGTPAGDVIEAADLAATMAEREREGGRAGGRAGGVRWVWWSAADLYPALLDGGVRVGRCHDVALAEAILAARDDSGPPATGAAGPDRPLADKPLADKPLANQALAVLRAAAARRSGARAAAGAAQQTLFDAEETVDADEPGPGPAQVLAALIAVHANQLAAVAADEHPARLGLLVAAESAGALAATEMTRAGLPWRADVHDAILTDLLGRRPAAIAGAAGAARPARLAVLAGQIAAAFGPQRPVNPDSPAQLLRAFAADGVRLSSTRLAVLAGVDHPAIPPLLEYKELSRLHSAFGWSWLDTWVAGGRFRPEYVVGGVVSGRWASRGGGALQIPRLLRRAVVADPGWVLVVADAAQLEPRVLAALAGDQAFAAAAQAGDLYAELAVAFGGEREKAKKALLSAMYGGAGGEAGQLLAVLRQRFPAAAGYVEAAARAGEEGRVVRSVLGRTCPPPSARWRALTEEAADPDVERDPSAGSASRARGRFTRNFVVQASAADWALVMLANLRAGLMKITSQKNLPPGSPSEQAGVQRGDPESPAGGEPELVFFQHDEVIVHCPQELADAVASAADRAANDAARQVFGPTRVAFPLTTAIVTCYGDAK
jgi:hypothetical protein